MHQILREKPSHSFSRARETQKKLEPASPAESKLYKKRRAIA